MQRISAVLPEDLFQQAQAAHYTDWRHERRHNNFSLWIGAQIAAYAELPSAERNSFVPTSSASPLTRSFRLSDDAVETMRAAVGVDQQRRDVSQSEWLVEALAAAVHTTAQRYELLIPPSPLPRRLY